MAMMAAGCGAANRLNVLLSDAEQGWSEQLPRLLEPQGVRTIRVGDVEGAVRVLERQWVHALVVDMGLPMECSGGGEEGLGRGAGGDGGGGLRGRSSGSPGGLKLLRVIRKIEPTPPAVVVRGRRFDRADDRLLREALKLQAFSVLDEPVEIEQLLETLRRLLRRHYGEGWPGVG